MMWRPVCMAGLVLFLCVPGMIASADAQEMPSAGEIAALMKASLLSDGFQLRMRITASDPDGPHALKIAVIGQFEANRARLALRVISPENMRNQSVAAQYRTGALPSAASNGEPANAGDMVVDPYARLFGTQLVPADMFAIWWDWPQQSLGESMRIGERDCTVVHSRAGALPGPVREVDSCVDIKGKVSLRMQIFGVGHKLLRTIVVEKTMHKEHGSLAARRLTISAEGGAVSTAEVYDGDEHYRPSVENFSVFN